MSNLFAFVTLFSALTADAEFKHPGVAHSQASIDFVKGKIKANEEPWTTAWKNVKESRDADLTRTPEPHAHVERGPYNNPNIGSSDFSRDATAAYTQALCWALSGDERHAKQSMKIVDAWSGTLKSISNHDARLLVGMEGYRLCIAGELLRHTWDGWPKENQERFRSMLREIFYPIIKDFYPSANGNWDASMLQTMLAMGVFLDDQAMFDRAKDYTLKGKGNGAIGNYFNESGQCQETGRDQGHTQMGLEYLSNTCETAWIQGIDLYGALDDRLFKGFEYTAKYNLGFDVPYEPYKSFEGRYHYKNISDKARGRLRPMYEKVLNHYQNRKKLDAPFTKQAAFKLRAAQPDRSERRRRRSSDLDTLMFADQPATFQAKAKETGANATSKPNVILIMTDDQGYGDLGCHGNPILETPNLDRLHAESVRLTDFHVSPFCTPTRAALMTGRYPARTGAYRTSSGRTMMHPDERSMANVFAGDGYATSMIGKWHLGDNAPHRPQDRGFQHTVWHRCGGVGQASDYWGNDYVDDTYERNGTFEKFEGYCTDVWFQEALRFIENKQEQPFFLYLAPNAPHGPYRVDPKWSQPYEASAKWRNGANFYGMVANIDHNVGLLQEKLDALGLTENTILIFMTDNGTANGAAFGKDTLNSEAVAGYNAGMRGKKSSIYEGGHRVPLFIRWPAGGLSHGNDLNHLSAHLDVLPTLAQLCGIGIAESHQMDGISFAEALRSPSASPHRDHLIVQFQGGAYFRQPPAEWEFACVLTKRWRLLDNGELYDMADDPAQRNDVAATHPYIVKKLRELYSPFWSSVAARMTPVHIDIGSPTENPTVLCSQDWYMPNGNPPWNFGSIRKLPPVTGPWKIHVRKAGRYRMTLRQFPVEANLPVYAVRASVRIGEKEQESSVKPGSKGVVFEEVLPAGRTELWTYLYDERGKVGGAYFTEVEALAP